MNLKRQFKSPFVWSITLFCIIFICVFIFTLVNDQMYRTPIGQITNIQNLKTEQVVDEHHNHDTKHQDQLTIHMLNGKYQGETTKIKHEYTESQADSEAFSPGNKVLMHIDKKPSDGYIVEKKRDSLVVVVMGIFLLVILLVGKKVGIQSILSLIFNTIAILTAIYLHLQFPNTSLFGLMSIAITLSTTITLLLITGWHWRTFVTIISTLLGTFLCIGITYGVIQATDGAGMKFETMSFLTLPPKTIFLASVIVGSLGAVMDVAITIASGMYEILRRSPNIEMTRWALAGRNIGQDIMGTMTNILLFSYLSGSLPMILIYLKNANTITYTLSINWSIELSRAITGGIGIVLTIPLTIILMQLVFKLRGVKQ